MVASIHRLDKDSMSSVKLGTYKSMKDARIVAKAHQDAEKREDVKYIVLRGN